MDLAHDVTGTGTAVLLLHAGVADRRMWDRQRDVLVAAGLRVVRADLPGFGGTPAAAQDYDEAAEVLGLMDVAVGRGTRFAVVGASYGGSVALALAARWPERVGALVLLCPAADLLEPGPDLRLVWRREAELLQAGDVDGAVALNVATWLGPEAGDDARTLVAAMQRRAFDLQALVGAEPVKVPVDLATVTAATLVLAGGRDLPEFRAVARAVSAAVPGAELVELPWAGHLPTLERPDEAAMAVRDFLIDRMVDAYR
ncbi:alpha/beta fold hydrolase [Georgenia muralis]|uniref:Pimeloyl-ACP methyl ester carboxylesterase n=1 Tax=Georgenia muralis TaxID=154117 RepID=A0A3N5A4G5_9MICO|nr:alpha/beta fold hydrolase [Georgenia muralis]RPF26681.1 pimeloyl-ACP methyl ester carboxylesterase [Georgenia muralis]